LGFEKVAMAKIWIGYVSCGLGHKKAGLSLAEVFDKDSPYIFNLLDFSFLKIFYEEGYRFLVEKLPLLWHLIYRLYFLEPFKTYLLYFHLFVFRNFVKEVIEKEPSVLISTHFFVSQIIAYLKSQKRIRAKLITVITDYGVHPLWLNKFTDYYIVSSQEQLNLISKKLSFPEERIKIYGIPLRRGFFKQQDLKSLEEKYRKPSKLFSILLFSSAFGLGPFVEIIKKFYKKCGIFVIYGRNKKVKNFLNSLKEPLYLLSFEYKEEIWELVELSDIIITKPGGISVTEAIIKKKSLLFMHYFPGQELDNLNYILKNKLGFYPKNTEELLALIDNLIKDRDILLKIRENFKKVELGDSALKVKKLALKLLKNDS